MQTQKRSLRSTGGKRSKKTKEQRKASRQKKKLKKVQRYQMLFKLFQDIDNEIQAPLGASVHDIHATQGHKAGLYYLDGATNRYPLLGKAQPVIGRPLVRPVRFEPRVRTLDQTRKMGTLLDVQGDGSCFFRAVYKSNRAKPSANFEYFAQAHHLSTSSETAFVYSIRSAYGQRGHTLNDKYRHVLKTMLAEYGNESLIHQFLMEVGTSPEYRSALGLTHHDHTLYFQGKALLRMEPTMQPYDPTAFLHHLRSHVDSIIEYLCREVTRTSMWVNTVEVRVLMEALQESNVTLVISYDQTMLTADNCITVYKQKHHYMGLQ
jgi:hypothetical protein